MLSELQIVFHVREEEFYKPKRAPLLDPEFF